MIDSVTAGRIFDELVALRESVSDVHAVVARVEERLDGVTERFEERQRKTSERVQKLEDTVATKVVVQDVDSRLKSLEVWRWVLVGAWLAIPASWVVFSILGGKP